MRLSVNLKQKEGNNVVRITKNEMEFLTKKKGVRFGEGGIFHTVARHRRTYYLTESKRNMRFLNQYRNPKTNEGR